jgi:NAD dependent epimerase/dehydratase family enzyme
LAHTAFTLVLPCAFTLVYPYATTLVYRCAFTLVYPYVLTFVCQCAGYYGNSQSQTFNESSTSGRDYLAEVCRDWENAAQQAKAKRVVIVRTGIVLAKEGGAMAKMLPIFNIFAGGPLGNGQQWCSWIHRFGAAVLSFILVSYSTLQSGVWSWL